MRDHSSQCLPLASTVTVDAISGGELVLEPRPEMVIVSVRVVVELVVVVKESDGEDDAEADPDHDGIATTVESTIGEETSKLVSNICRDTIGRACMCLRTGMAAF